MQNMHVRISKPTPCITGVTEVTLALSFAVCGFRSAVCSYRTQRPYQLYLSLGVERSAASRANNIPGMSAGPSRAQVKVKGKGLVALRCSRK